VSAFKQSECSKLRDNVSDVVRELREYQDDRLRFPPDQILERYLRGNLALLIELSFEFSTQWQFPRKVSAHLSYQGQRPTHVPSGVHDDKLFVLVNNVHVVNKPEHIGAGIRSRVRLEFLDELASTDILHTLYFSAISGKLVFRRWPRIQNGEFKESSFFGVARNVVGELPDNVIETRSKVVDNFSGKNTKANRYGQFFEVCHCLSMFLTIYIWEDGVFAFLKEPGDLRLKIDDVLIGPFILKVNTPKGR
jgi:hypothetical protein